jgi:transcriptional regulator of acetoin/glycerol metabolism
MYYSSLIANFCRNDAGKEFLSPGRAPHKVAKVVATDVPVLLLGETGSGRELVAEAVRRERQRGMFQWRAVVELASTARGLRHWVNTWS